MAAIISLHAESRRHARPERRREEDGHTAKILMFTGVRFERRAEDEKTTTDENTAKKY